MMHGTMNVKKLTNLRLSELGLDSAVTDEIYCNPHDHLYCPLSMQKWPAKTYTLEISLHAVNPVQKVFNLTSVALLTL